MPQFYFRQYMNGQQMAKDQEGREFASLAEACTYAARPAFLEKSSAWMRIRISAQRYPMVSAPYLLSGGK
jgi:hypothetical protein